MADNVIDLTDSFILADHQALTNVVIELDTDDSGLIELDSDTSMVETAPMHSRDVHHRKTNRKMEVELMTNNYNRLQKQLICQQKNDKTISSEKQSKFGDCPICYDPLGDNPLASTKCGHVYCMKCLKQYLLGDQKCPTCRQSLKGKSSYHPLYLSSNT